MCTVFGIKYIVGAQWTVIIIWVNVKLESFEKNLKKKHNFWNDCPQNILRLGKELVKMVKQLGRLGSWNRIVWHNWLT